MTRPMQRDGVLAWNLAFSAGAAAAGWAFVSPRFAGSLALGAVLEAVNFRSMWRFSERVLLGKSSGAFPAIGAFGLRFVLLAVVLWVALGAGAHPVGLVVGLSMIVPAVVLAAWRARPQDLPAGEAPAVPPPDDESWDEWNPWLARERDPEEEDDA